MTGVAITRVTLKKLNGSIIPMPPVEEQKRIVTKVDELMSICDKLEQQLKQAYNSSDRLMESTVHSLLRR